VQASRRSVTACCKREVLHLSLGIRSQVYVLSELFEDRGATLLSTVQQLPELQKLDVFYEGEEPDGIAINDSNGLPRCKEVAGLHSRSLQWLRVAMLDGPAEGNTLRLRGLPELRTCVLLGHARRSDLHIQIDAASFKGAPKLQQLHVEYDDELRLSDGSLERLTALTKLTLADCRLKSVPADVASLSATLSVLDLSRNDPLQLDAETVTNIVQCSRLTTLSLVKEEVLAWTDSIDVERDPHEEGYAPAPWDLWSGVLLGAAAVCVSPAAWSGSGRPNTVYLVSTEVCQATGTDSSAQR